MNIATNGQPYQSRKLNLFSHNFTFHKAEIIFFINSFHQQKKAHFCFISLGLENQSKKSNTIRKHEKSNPAHPEL